MGRSKTKGVEAKKFGTFAGVFTPSLLTILGVIMYQRLGWLVGHTGLVGSLVIIILAHVISLTTGLSVASIATSRTVRTGGAYHIISRSLGLPIGGAIGLGLFVAMSLAVSLYLIGFAENFVQVVGLGDSKLARQAVATGFCILLTVVAFVSTSLAMRLQFVVLAAIVGSLLSFLLGHSGGGPEIVALWPSEGSVPLETAFAVFFPAVTGFTSGIAMAGDLKNPSKSIPIGTMAAIIVALVVYIALPIFLATQVTTDVLRTDMNVWMSVSAFSPLVVAGIWGATLSSALASILGAPRVLQALAKDHVVPGLLGRGHGGANEPRVAMIVCFLIAQAGIIIGDLDLVAPIISMCFLTCYGMICLACGLERWAGSPSFRPQFKVPSWVSLLGAFACFAVMFKLQMLAMVAAMALMGIIFLLLQRRQLRLTSGDTWEGVWSALGRWALLKLYRKEQDGRNWRPNILTFAGTTTQRPHLIHMGGWIVRDSGLLTNHLLVEGSLESDRERAAQMHRDVDQLLGLNFPTVLLRTQVCPDIYDGIRTAVQASGIGGLLPNTVLLGWGGKTTNPGRYTALLRDIVLLDHNLLLLAHDEARSFGTKERIDVWWGGKEYNWNLMVLLASLLQLTDEWEKAKVRLLVVVPKKEERLLAEKKLLQVLADAKLRAEAHVLCAEDPSQSAFEIIRKESASADLTMLGFKEPEVDEVFRRRQDASQPFRDASQERAEAFVSRINGMVQGLGTVLLVRASSRFEGTHVLFEQGD